MRFVGLLLSKALIPKKKWKKIILSAFLIILASLVIIVGYLEYSVYREVSSPLAVLNSNGAKTALVIYHLGLSPFAHDIAYAFANGLASSGWRVEIATASPQEEASKITPKSATYEKNGLNTYSHKFPEDSCPANLSYFFQQWRHILVFSVNCAFSLYRLS